MSWRKRRASIPGNDNIGPGDALDMTQTWFDSAANSALKLGVPDTTLDNWQDDRDASLGYVAVSTRGLIPELWQRRPVSPASRQTASNRERASERARMHNQPNRVA
jgi:hypothetical protein